MSYLQVEFADGQTGRYPCSEGATVTIQEPDQTPMPGTSEKGATFAFGLEGVTSIGLVAGDLSPANDGVEAETAPGTVTGSVASGPVVLGENQTSEPVSVDPTSSSTAPSAVSQEPLVSSSSSLAEPVFVSPAVIPAVDVPADAPIVVAAVQAAPVVSQAQHASAAIVDVEAALAKWPGDPQLTDALAQLQDIVLAAPAAS
jgi:hypothetical protein